IALPIQANASSVWLAQPKKRREETLYMGYDERCLRWAGTPSHPTPFLEEKIAIAIKWAGTPGTDLLCIF
ncbi:MAG: hypothetical protein ACYT04_84305, partial [Nostoc sp.]